MAVTTTTLEVDAILFDLDGTLVDSAVGLVNAWELFREKYPSIDVQHILHSAHGVRNVDNLRKYCGIEDPRELEREAERFDRTVAENGSDGLKLLPGVKAVLEELASRRQFPNPGWAICTSATRIYASSALRITGLPVPDVIVVAEDVNRGKPFPDPYLLGAKRCGVKPENCVVFEDAPNGVRSGKAAGCKVVGLLTSHGREQIEASQPDFIIKDLSKVSVDQKDNKIKVIIHED